MFRGDNCHFYRKASFTAAATCDVTLRDLYDRGQERSQVIVENAWTVNFAAFARNAQSHGRRNINSAGLQPGGDCTRLPVDVLGCVI